VCSPFYRANRSPSCFCIHWRLQHERLSLLLPCFLLSHRHPSLLSIHQPFLRLTQHFHHPNRRERGNLKQSFCGKCALDPVQSLAHRLGDPFTIWGIGHPHIPELPLLRDALYLLQGISGKHVRFATGKDGGTEMSLLFTEDSVRVASWHWRSN
jgi:hypothetical protein